MWYFLALPSGLFLAVSNLDILKGLITFKLLVIYSVFEVFKVFFFFFFGNTWIFVDFTSCRLSCSEFLEGKFFILTFYL